jgi:hypothetical protein
MWKIFTMSELWKILNPKPNKLFVEPNFPTRRWSNTTTKTSTTDIKAINKGIFLLKENNIKCRKKICIESNKKFKQLGKFYKIEIKK